MADPHATGTRVRYFWVSVGYATARIDVRDDVVVGAAPIFHWMIGQEFRTVDAWVRRKRGRIIELDEGDE